MSNKPTLPNAFVDINSRNLGNSPNTPSGIFAFAGIAVDGTATAETVNTIGSLNEVRSKIGYGALADDLVDFFNAGGRRALAYPIAPTTESTLSAVTKTAVGTSTGTITIAKVSGKVVPNVFSLKVEITRTGDIGEGKFKYSTDAGLTFSPENLIPASFVIPGTEITLTFVKGAGAVYFEDGDLHTATASKPVITDAKIESAVDAFIASTEVFDGIVISNPCGTSLLSSLKTKAVNAEASPNFRYIYIVVRPALSATPAAAITGAAALVAAVQNDHIQIVTSEMLMIRPNQSNDIQQRNVIGVIVGRRSSLAISEDLGLFSAGGLPNMYSKVADWTETTIEDLDALKTVTVREFKGVAGYRPTNGWMSDPYSDMSKDAFKLIIDKAASIARVSALAFLKVKVDPSDVVASTENLKATVENDLNTKLVGAKDAVAVSVIIPEGQDILATEQINMDIGVLPYGHASFIGITIGLVKSIG